jgi:PadR family transcriptional regulator, regulatory protein PadR
MGNRDTNAELMPGTLDMLILKTLTLGSMHGYGVAQHILKVSGNVLAVGEGSLYPALQRLMVNGWVAAEWGVSENKRRARYYKLTPAGRRQLGVEKQNYARATDAIARVMQSA